MSSNTANEYILNNYQVINGQVDIRDARKSMIEFAKLHVTAALKQASDIKKFYIWDDTIKDFEIDKQSILNSYNLDNIK